MSIKRDLHKPAQTLAAIFMLASLLTACEGGLMPTPIAKILENPRDYEGKTIHVKGTVTESLNLLAIKYYVLKDDTGEITVVTDRILPKVGETATVEGHVEEAFSIGDIRSIVIVEKSADVQK